MSHYRNSRRVAEVWLDQKFKNECFYKALGRTSSAHQIGDLQGIYIIKINVIDIFQQIQNI